MKIFTVLLTLSAAVNLALLAVLFVLRDAKNEMINLISPRTTAPSDDVPSASGSSVSGEKTNRPHDGHSVIQWSQIDTTDLPELVRRLRAMGFPPALVNSLIEMRVRDLFAARRETITGRKRETDYWKSPYNERLTQKQRETLSVLGLDEFELKIKLLGRDYMAADEGYADYLTEQYGDMSPQKLATLAGISSDYDQLRMEAVRAAYAKGKGATPEVWAQLNLIEEQRRTEIAGTLTPDERQAMELRSSIAANILRANARFFRSTEAEFLALFPIYKSVETAMAPSLDQTPFRAALQLIQPQIAATLGPERYAEYQQATNPAYEKLNRIVQRLDLPISAAISIASVQQDTIQQADAVRSDITLTADQKRARIDSLAQASLAKISSSLGSQGFEAYKRYGTQWLKPLGVTVTTKK